VKMAVDRETNNPGSDSFLPQTIAALWIQGPVFTISGFVFGLLATPVLALFIAGVWLLGLALFVIWLAPLWAVIFWLVGKVLTGEKIKPRDYFISLKKFAWRGIALGGIVAIPIFIGLTTLDQLGSGAEVVFIYQLGMATNLAVWVLCLAISIYALPLVVFMDASLITALGIGLGMAIHKPINTFGLLSLGFLLMLGIAYISPALIFFFPIIWVVFIVKNFQIIATGNRI